MSDIATGIMQSKKLIELGIDVSTADFTWLMKDCGGYDLLKKEDGTDYRLDYGGINTETNAFSYRNGYMIPAWSVTALLKLAPSDTSITVREGEGDGRFYTCDCYECGTSVHDSAIDAIYDLICHIYKNKNNNASMKNIATSTEQGEILMKLGVDIKTADLCWKLIYDENHLVSDYKLDLIPYRLYSGTGIPAWTLSALLELIPTDDVPVLTRGSDYPEKTNDWFCYLDDNLLMGENPKGKTPIDAAFELVCHIYKTIK